MWHPRRSAGSAVAVVLVAAATLLALAAPRCLASDFNSPHSHTGKVSPFEPGDPKVALNAKAVQILDSGRPYQTQIQSGTSGRGLVVQDVHAPPDVVWSRILDYDNYATMVPKTVESKNYEVVKHRPTKRDPLAQTIYTRMKVGFPMIRLEFFVRHLYFPSLNSLTWTLDYTKKSDFDDSVGYWYVVPHPDRPESWTRVYYSVEVSMFDWVPKFVVDFMSSKALTDATGWVKKYSEMEWEKDPRREEVESRAGEGADDGKRKKGRRKKRGILGFLFGLFNPGKRRRVDGRIEGGVEDDAPRGAAAAAECDAASQVCENPQVGVVSETDGDGDRRKPSRVKTVGAIWVRFGLISLVSILLVYNISLCLDRMSQ